MSVAKSCQCEQARGGRTTLARLKRRPSLHALCPLTVAPRFATGQPHAKPARHTGIWQDSPAESSTESSTESSMASSMDALKEAAYRAGLVA